MSSGQTWPMTIRFGFWRPDPANFPPFFLHHAGLPPRWNFLHGFPHLGFERRRGKRYRRISPDPRWWRRRLRQRKPQDTSRLKSQDLCICVASSSSLRLVSAVTSRRRNCHVRIRVRIHVRVSGGFAVRIGIIQILRLKFFPTISRTRWRNILRAIKRQYFSFL